MPLDLKFPFILYFFYFDGFPYLSFLWWGGRQEIQGSWAGARRQPEERGSPRRRRSTRAGGRLGGRWGSCRHSSSRHSARTGSLATLSSLEAQTMSDKHFNIFIFSDWKLFCDVPRHQFWGLPWRPPLCRWWWTPGHDLLTSWYSFDIFWHILTFYLLVFFQLVCDLWDNNRYKKKVAEITQELAGYGQSVSLSLSSISSLSSQRVRLDHYDNRPA